MQAEGEVLTHASIGCRVVGPFPLFAVSSTSMSAKVVNRTMPLLYLHIHVVYYLVRHTIMPEA